MAELKREKKLVWTETKNIERIKNYLFFSNIFLTNLTTKKNKTIKIIVRACNPFISPRLNLKPKKIQGIKTIKPQPIKIIISLKISQVVSSWDF